MRIELPSWVLLASLVLSLQMQASLANKGAVSRLYAYGANSATGMADKIGLNTIFIVTPIPRAFDGGGGDLRSALRFGATVGCENLESKKGEPCPKSPYCLQYKNGHMKKKLLSLLSLLLLISFAVLSTAGVVLGAVITVPDALSGNSSLALFDYAPGVSIRYQQVYAASGFSAIRQGGGLITQIAFRFENPQGLFGVGVSNIQVNFSTTPRDVDALSTTFSQNVGPDDTIVFGPGPVGWPGGSAPAQFALTSPFFYNPGMGNLLMDIRLFNGGTVIGMSNAFLDASNIDGDPVSGLFTFDVNSLTGTACTVGLVTAFTATPIREPRSLFLLLVAGATCLLMRRWRFSLRGHAE